MHGGVRRHGLDALMIVAALESTLEVALRRDAAQAPTSALWFVVPATAALPLLLLARRRFPFWAPASVWILGTAISFVAGNVSGLLGVGGGVINVPTMNLLMHVPIRVATTTSTYMLAATAVASALVYLAAGQVDPLLAAPVALGVIVGARLGARLALLVSQDVLRVAFVVVALVFAASMIREALGL